jgi:hypothetical protein
LRRALRGDIRFSFFGYGSAALRSFVGDLLWMA